MNTVRGCVGSLWCLDNGSACIRRVAGEFTGRVKKDSVRDVSLCSKPQFKHM